MEFVTNHKPFSCSKSTGEENVDLVQCANSFALTDLQSVSAYDYELSDDYIAQTPIEPRDQSRLLVLNRKTGNITHTIFRNIRSFLKSGDLLVANESRVFPARLYGNKADTGGQVEILLLSIRPDIGSTAWEGLVKPGRRLRSGSTVLFPAGLVATIVDSTPAKGRIIRFSIEGKEDTSQVNQILSMIGTMPLPPYIHEPLRDPERYQTVYSKIAGSAAAPTAGLHFTSELLSQLESDGIDFAQVTLHVGLDTFRPVEVENLKDHHIHSESIELSAHSTEAINKALTDKRRIIAVGTTTVRTLEGVATQQGIPLQPYSGRTDLFITPGFHFQIVDAMITNFHLPRSTLLALVSAFAGYDLIQHAYSVAIAEKYRFFSFGDAMLIL
jgi:S-adenosylmethionine:tRNA ribosyltransferase-isomerase